MSRYSLFLITLLLLSSIVQAEIGMGGRGPGGRMQGGQRAQQTAQPAVEFDDKSTLRQILTYGKELDLTDGQIETIRKIRSDSINEARKKYEVLSAAQKDLADIVGQVKPDFSAARAKIKEITGIAIDIQSGSVDAYEKAFNTLTNEQKEKLFVIRDKLLKDRAGQEPVNGDVEKSQ